jgi:hypothetical protein
MTSAAKAGNDNATLIAALKRCATQDLFFVHIAGLALFLAFPGPASASSTAPPIGENVYCDKGNVAKFGPKDGPAEMPRTCYYTGLDGTPSPGKQIKVAAKEDLTAAVDSAKCGDTLLLAAGASYEIRDLPAKKCDDSHYITIRTDTPDAKLPPEGTRISPAWAGVASLPGRPAFAQPAGGPAKLMATLYVKKPSGANVGDHYRFIGIEWTAPPDGKQGEIGRLATTEEADHVIFDRNWFHPQEGGEMGKGIGMIRGTRYIAVINSYLSGFNCVSRSGTCTDAVAVGGGNSPTDAPNSTLKIYNNFLEASGENILFGGANSEVNPTDIEIRRNHLFKPLIWKLGEAGFTGAPNGDPFIIKNHLELKSGIRVLVEANLLENCWGGFSQTGFSIAVSPKNQNDHCPKCSVTDITIRYNRIRNVGGGIIFANINAGHGGAASDGDRYSVHDLLVDAVHDEESWKAQSTFSLILSNEPPIHDLALDHVTAFVPGPLFQIRNHNEEKIHNFSITNSILMAGGRRPEFSSAGGGQANCATRTQRVGAEAVLNECFDPYKFANNMIIGSKGGWPKGTIVVGSPDAAGLRDIKNGVAKDARLCHTKGDGCGKASPGASAASDGRDIGVDVDGLDAALAGVE